MFKRDKRKGEDHDDELEGDDTGADKSGDSAEEPNALTLMGVMGGAGGDADLDLQSMSEGSRLLNRGTMLVLAVVIIAAGALYGMRMSQSDAGTSEEVKSAEAKIDKLMAKKVSVDGALGDTEVILTVLNDDRTRRQVPIEFTKQNPFLLLLEQAKAEGPAKAVKPAEDPEAIRRAELKQKLDAEFKKLNIQSVVPTGRTPVAIINNKILKVGQEIGSFTVKDIRNTTVVLEAEGQQYSLSLESDPNKPGK